MLLIPIETHRYERIYPRNSREAHLIIHTARTIEPLGIKAPCKRTQHCWPTTPNIVGCYMLRPFAHPVACFWMLLRVVAQSLKPVKLFSQRLPTFLLFRNRRSVAQQCWIVCIALPTFLGVVASVCTPLPTRTQQLPTLLRQRCWELLRPFARTLTNETNYNHYVILICFSVYFSYHVILCNFSLLYYLTTEYIM